MSETWFQKDEKYFFHTYHRLPLEIERAEGVYIYTKDGKRCTDFFGGLAVNALGHCHPRIIAAVEKQIHRYMHVSNYFLQEPQVELAERLLKLTGYEKVFFSNSGTEAVEGAIKLSRKWGKKNGKTRLLSMTNSFHGRTMGALSLTERPKYRDGYEPFLPDTDSVEFNNVKDLIRKAGTTTLAVILEFIQGEGGVNVVSAEFVKSLAALQKQFGFLIIADEIQTGVGRTGKFFAFQNFDVHPDIVVLAKAIGGGLPLGAILGNGRVADIFAGGSHGTTFGGNPVACAAGCAVVDEILEKKLMNKASDIGVSIKSKALELQIDFPRRIKEVRGIGCMIGIELYEDAQPLVDELLLRGFLANCTNTTVLRLLPPYLVEEEQCEALMFEIRSILQTKR
ncbi:MAG: aspartate aminotransferase family protein [Bacteroidota bacterium]